MNRPRYRRSDEIAAYTYRADLYCPGCTIEAMIATGIAAPAARDMTTVDVLDQCSAAMAIDRDDETSFDSDEFPKPALLDWLDPPTPARPATNRCSRPRRVPGQRRPRRCAVAALWAGAVYSARAYRSSPSASSGAKPDG